MQKLAKNCRIMQEIGHGRQDADVLGHIMTNPLWYDSLNTLCGLGVRTTSQKNMTIHKKFICQDRHYFLYSLVSLSTTDVLLCGSESYADAKI